MLATARKSVCADISRGERHAGGEGTPPGEVGCMYILEWLVWPEASRTIEEGARRKNRKYIEHVMNYVWFSYVAIFLAICVVLVMKNMQIHDNLTPKAA